MTASRPRRLRVPKVLSTCQWPCGLTSAMRSPLVPGPGPGHVRGHATFVQENLPLRRDGAELVQERLAPLPVGFRVPLLGVK
jgi:hypothetical protein